MNNTPSEALPIHDVDQRAQELFEQVFQSKAAQLDRLFVILMAAQWLGGVLAALVISPRTWIGESNAVHIHVWAALILGGVMFSGPLMMHRLHPGHWQTRHVIAIAQGLWSALLIHLFGGRLETHFHVFGSLAFVALYRDWKVILTISAVIAADHAIRGVYWPLSVYGVALESPWRWLEHTAWVIFEDIVLITGCIWGTQEIRSSCLAHAELEDTNARIEAKVVERSSELQNARDFFQSVLDSMQAHICVLDRRGCIVETNAKWEAFASGNGGERFGTGSNYLEVCRAHENNCLSAGEVATAIEAIIRGEELDYVAEYECHSPSEDHWYQVNVTPLVNHSGGAAVVAHTEITERVRAQQELRSASQELELLSLVAKYTDNAVVITDALGRIEWVNDGFERLTGYTIEEISGKVPGAFLQGVGTDPNTIEEMRLGIRNLQGFDAELINYRKDGEPYWLAIEVRPILDRNGAVQKFIAIESDITSRKLAEKELAQLNRDIHTAARQAGMAEVATGVLHNVGNVLNSLNVSTQTLASIIETSPVERFERAAEIVLDHQENIAGFLQNDPRGKLFPEMLREFSRRFAHDRDSELSEIQSALESLEHIRQIISQQQGVARSRQDLLLETVNMERLVNDAWRLCQAAFNSHRRKPEILVECDNDLEYVTDKHKILQILVNLVQNAVQACAGLEVQPQIRVVVSAEAEHIEIAVTDNGKGISRDHLPQIFRHGFTTKDGGHGFGLHSSALDAKLLGGSLSVDSPGTNQGATFSLRLPRKTSESASPQLSVNAH